MSYVAGTDLAFQVDLINASGQTIPAVTVQYRVLDELGVVRADWQAVVGYAPGQPASVTVLAAVNALDVNQTKAGREIELLCTQTDGSKQIASKFYVIEAATGYLVRGVNTLVTVSGAELLATNIPKLGNWSKANRMEKTTALIEAYRRLGKLRFSELDNYWYDRSGPFRRLSATSLVDLTPNEVLNLDPKALAALALGQVSEADFVLSVDSTESRRQDGLILETIGEVKQMYRNTKPVELPVCKRTLGYVGAYMTIGSKVIGRL